jgi:hypothetical protein
MAADFPVSIKSRSQKELGQNSAGQLISKSHLDGRLGGRMFNKCNIAAKLVHRRLEKSAKTAAHNRIMGTVPVSAGTSRAPSKNDGRQASAKMGLPTLAAPCIKENNIVKLLIHISQFATRYLSCD